jgi:hypothetical protein
MASLIIVKDIAYGSGRDHKECAFVTLAISTPTGEQFLQVEVTDFGDEQKILEAVQVRLSLLLKDLAAELERSKLRPSKSKAA